MFEACLCGNAWKAAGSLGWLKESNAGTEDVGQGRDFVE